jgi:hypothetical protein
MNASPSLLAQPLAPEQWIVCSEDMVRRAGIEAELANSGELYISWRLRHGLVRFVEPGELAAALNGALDGLAPDVHVFHDLPSGAIHQWLGAPPDRESRRRLHIRRLTGPSVAPIVRELSRPDGLVEAGWLFDGRRSRPALDGASQAASFIDEEARAFDAWSQAFVALRGEAELDAIYGSTREAEEVPDNGDDVADTKVLAADEAQVRSLAPSPQRLEVIAGLDKRFHPMDLDDLPLAASSEQPAALTSAAAPHAAGAAPGIETLLVQVLRPESGSWRAPPDPDGRIEVYSQAEPGDGSRRCLTVDVSLWGARWAGRDELVLALIPRTQRPLLIRLGARHLPADTAWGEGAYLGGERRWWVTLRHTVDQSVAEALRGGTIALHDFTDEAAAAPAAHADGPSDV